MADRNMKAVVIAAAVAGIGFASTQVNAANILWGPTTSAGTAWATGSNWLLGTAPGSGDIAVFDSATTFKAQPIVSTASVNGIVFGDTSGTASVTTTISGTGLTIGGAGVHMYDGTAVTQTISATTTLGASQSWTNDSTSQRLAFSGSTGFLNTNGQTLSVDGAGATSIVGQITGSGSIVKSNAGTLSLQGSGTVSSFSGGLTIKSGTVVVGGGSTTIASGVLGTSVITLGNSTATNTDSATFASGGTLLPTIANQINLAENAGGTLKIAASGTLATIAGNSAGLTLTGTINLNNHDLVLTSLGTGNLTIQPAAGSSGIVGSSKLIIDTDRTTSGATGNQGIVILDGNSGTASTTGNPNFTGNVEVRNGALRLQAGGAYGSTYRPILSNGSVISVASGAYFDVQTTTSTFAGLNNYGAHGGTVGTGQASGVTAILGGGDSYSFDGLIRDGSTAGTLQTAATVGVLSLSANLTGTQQLIGANTYTGVTRLSSGTLSVTNLADGSSGIGNAANLASNLVFNGGTLKFTGSTASNLGRLFTVNAGGGTIDSSGAAALNFNNGASIAIGDAANRSGTATGTTITSSNLVNDLAVGMSVTGSGIADGTTVASINYLNNTFTLSQAPTGAIGALSFGSMNRVLTLTGSNSAANTMGNVLTDALTPSTSKLGVTKNGSGTWILSKANTYTGATTVNAGTLLINSDSASAVTVNAGTVGGTANSSAAVTIGDGSGSGDAVIAPGNAGTGTFTTASTLNLLGDAKFAFELNSTTGAADKIVANGVTIAPGAQFNFSDLGTGAGVTDGELFTIIDNTAAGSLSGQFANLADGASFSSNGITYTAHYGNDLTLTAAVPEPACLGLLIGAVGLLRRRR